MTATAATTRPPAVALLLRPVPRSLGPTARRGVVAGILLGAALIAACALIHLHLWGSATSTSTSSVRRSCSRP
jgi:hypothetical protein